MKTSTPSLTVISFLFKSCHSHNPNNSKETALFTEKDCFSKPIPLFEESKLQSVNHRSLIVLNHNIQKNILTTEIKTQNTTTSEEIIAITVSSLSIIIPITTLNSDFVFNDYSFSKN
ncbi:hypothetical protein [Flavobacterium daejeonense]|uniref:hypothetical protein n=1 Tax=Flavobacterium daejeonense TaxID=350893 RepID=UPI00047C38ED|nr:hypothetical protein [Flavobacterium daejeonense]